MKTMAWVLVAIVLTMTVSAMDKDDGVVTTTPKYALPSWAGTVAPRCVLKEYSYPNGGSHKVMGILAKRSDGSKICFVPTFGGRKRYNAPLVY